MIIVVRKKRFKLTSLPYEHGLGSYYGIEVTDHTNVHFSIGITRRG